MTTTNKNQPATLIITAVAPITETDHLMRDCALADKSSYGAKARLAAHLNAVMPPMWHSAPKGKTPLAEQVEGKRIAMQAIYTANGVAYFDQAWSVTKKYAAEIEAGVRDADTGDLITEGEDGEGKGKQERKDCDQAWLDALTGLITRTEKDQKAGRPAQSSLHYVRMARRMIALSKSMSKLDAMAKAVELVV